MAPRAVLSALLLVGLVAYCTLQAAESTETAYEKVLQAIDNWIGTIPAERYKVAEGDQVFQWKVGLEENPTGGPERFLYYDELLKQIGTSEFTYGDYTNWKFNATSIRYYQVLHYADYYRNRHTITPSEFFAKQYGFYKQHISSKAEQWVWLDGFFDFLNGYYADSQGEFVDSLTTNCRAEVIEVLKQYIFLSGYMLDKNPKVILNGEDYYSSSTVFYSGTSEVDHVLGQLLSFVQNFKSELKQPTKELILNFAIPKYQDSDVAVKLYAALK